jgi:prepilin signal peptidase PulO-like enzyme (type II secretory pathway)
MPELMGAVTAEWIEAASLLVQPWFFFLLGLCYGSFLNVVFYRVPLGKSVVAPGSSCPGCDRAIAFYDNLPVISYLVLRGHCRSCRMKISLRYPAIELVFGFLFAVGPLLTDAPFLALGLSLTVATSPAAFVLWRKARRGHGVLWLLLFSGLMLTLWQLAPILSRRLGF